MILKILVLVAAMIAAILGYAATKPDTFHIQRSIDIKASPEKVFVLIDDLHNWTRWAPQDKQDSSMKRTSSGAPNESEWEGVGNTGKGHMLITASVPPSAISIKVDWVKPIEANNTNDSNSNLPATEQRSPGQWGVQISM